MRDWFANAFGAAVADVRQKLIEEAWFGRAVTPQHLDQPSPANNDRTIGEKLGWDAGSAKREPPAPDLDFDR